MSGNGNRFSPHGFPQQSAGEQSGVRIRPLQEIDVMQAANIHIRTIPYSINALLGVAHLADTYRTLMRTDAAVSLVAVNEAGRVVGAVTGVTNRWMLLRAIFRSGILLSLPVRLLVHPKACVAIVAAVFHATTRHPRGVRAALTSVVVDNADQGMGVGSRLVAALEEIFAGRGITRYWLETRSNNTKAIEFYRKMGFVEFSRTRSDTCFVKQIAVQESRP